jgi:hypothetical protein
VEVLHSLALLFGQAACQHDTELEYPAAEVDEEDMTAEHDAMLIEAAGDVIPAIAKLVGGQKFSPYFAGFLPDILKRLVSKQVHQ